MEHTRKADAEENLRAFQDRLAEKLKAASDAGAQASMLGFVAGGRHWLVNLGQVNEVVTAPQLAQAPWCKPWFAGVASVRGVIHGCIDLGAYAGVAEPMARGESRLLLLHPRYGVHAALRIERVLGLRPLTELRETEAAGSAPTWQGRAWLDGNGTHWTEISIPDLVAQPEFLEVGQ